jgi:hypothetical protein
VESHSSLFPKPSDGKHKEQLVQWPAQQQQQQQQCSPGATTHHPNSADASHAADPQQHAAQSAASTSTPPPHQSGLAEFLRTRPTTFSQAKDPMDAEDWLKGVEKKLMIAQCTDHEKVLFAVHQLLVQQLTGGRRFAIPMQTSTPSPGTSSRLVSAPTTCPVAQ